MVLNLLILIFSGKVCAEHWLVGLRGNINLAQFFLLLLSNFYSATDFVRLNLFIYETELNKTEIFTNRLENLSKVFFLYSEQAQTNFS